MDVLPTLLAVLVGMVALVMALSSAVASPGKPGGRIDGVLSDEEIEARITRLLVLGELPPGWSRRDAARLLRIEARRVALRRS